MKTIIRGVVINEVGHVYGPWLITKLLDDRQRTNGCAQFEATCQYCGHKKKFIGNNLRFDNYAHRCDHCGAK